mmetsp:Transcript_24330/g.54792  ORF Transcript_24330/g.54792 Transcript_24330/m.54792 type:complete len:231 (-) Transcript_24330:381-1073(-)
MPNLSCNVEVVVSVGVHLGDSNGASFLVPIFSFSTWCWTHDRISMRGSTLVVVLYVPPKVDVVVASPLRGLRRPIPTLPLLRSWIGLGCPGIVIPTTGLIGIILPRVTAVHVPVVNHVYMRDRSRLPHHARRARQAHLSRRPSSSRWTLASSRTRRSWRPLIAFWSRSSILSRRSSFTLLARLTILSWRPILARLTVFARRTRRAWRPIFPWGAWRAVGASFTRRSRRTW